MRDTIEGIRLTELEAAKQFATDAGKFNVNITLATGDYPVNGKSLFGIFSLNLSRPVTIDLAGTEEEVVRAKEFFLSNYAN